MFARRNGYSPKRVDKLDDVSIFLLLVSSVLLVSFICLLRSVFNFADYADEFIISHLSSFNGISDTKAARTIVRVALCLRLGLALTWGASIAHLRYSLRRYGAKKYWIMMGYGLLWVVGSLYLVINARVTFDIVSRALQLALSLIVICGAVYRISTASFSRSTIGSNSGGN